MCVICFHRTLKLANLKCVERRLLKDVLDNEKFILEKLIPRWKTLLGCPTKGDAQDDDGDAQDDEEEMAVPLDARELLYDSGLQRNIKRERIKIRAAIKYWETLLKAEQAYADSPSDLTTHPFLWVKLVDFRQPTVIPLPPICTPTSSTPLPEGVLRFFVGHEADQPLTDEVFDLEQDLRTGMAAIVRVEGDEKYSVCILKGYDADRKQLKVQWQKQKDDKVPPEEAQWIVWKRSLFQIDVDTVQWATWFNKSKKTFKRTEQDIVKHVIYQLKTFGAVKDRPALITDPEDDDDNS